MAKKETRIWCDGCYDLVHFGHANSFRQARAFGDYLIVGVHSDADIKRHKGPPILTEAERCKMIGSIKWVDEVIPNQPYTTTLETLNKFNCDFCCHGDDITLTADGVDTYHQIKTTGRYKEVKRTAGISTTNLIRRILALSGKIQKTISPWTGQEFFPTTRKILQFTNGSPPNAGDTIIYAPGSFDLFHVGHVDFLAKSRSKGNFLIVGLYDDTTIKKLEGPQFPVMTLHERLLCVLSCRYVSEVVIGAPFVVSENLMDHFNISLVTHGKTCINVNESGGDPFDYPKNLGKFKIVNSQNDMSVDEIVRRVSENRGQIEMRNKKKEKKEMELIGLFK